MYVLPSGTEVLIMCLWYGCYKYCALFSHIIIIDITLLKAPNYPGPLLLDISLVQSFPGSQDPSRPLPNRAAAIYRNILDHPDQRTSALSHNAKNNKYLRVCADNGVSFLPFIVESNGYLHLKAQEFLRDLAYQASFYRSLYLLYLYSIYSSSIYSL